MKKKYSLFAIFIVVLSLVLSACGGSGSSKETSGGTGSGGGSGSSDQNVKLEIFSWWTAGGESDALKALLKGFKAKYPDIKVVNAAVAGGAGSNAKAVLATRMQGGDPPSTFQVHGGAELFTWVDAGKMQPLDELYKKNNWKDKFPQKVIDMNSKNGHVWGVPVDIHRGNVIFYNKAIFDKYGIQPPKTFDDFFAACKKLKANGVTPLALGDKNIWPATMLFEDTLLGTLGPDKYAKLWTGDLSFDSDGVRQAAETFKKMLSYTNSGHSSLAWQDASQLVIDGKAAMNVMGDWAEGYFVSKGWKPNEDFGWVETPGTAKDFMIINDSFGLPKGVDNPDAVKKFLSYLGSPEAQATFNNLKGSIPANMDADMSKFNVYSKSTMKDFKAADENGTITLSLAHGSAAPPGFLNQVNTAVNMFVTQKNVDTFIKSLQSASSQLK
ncbi:MAG TPA: ABC transporter substrate-binding protein [Bacillales bacterium]|nr:ABC transporter substrate-binding protein [Bacillales bacterium]